MVRLFVLLCVLAVVTLGCTLRETVSVNAAMKHLSELNKIAYEHQGNRAAGSSGYEASVDHILESLRMVPFFDVQLQSFSFQTTRLEGTPKMKQIKPTPLEFAFGTDFGIFSNTPSGTVDAPLVTVSNLGCTSDDYSRFPAGAIALVFRGSCSFSEKEAMAAQAKASAIIIYNSDGGGPFNGRIDNPTIPAFSMAHWLGKFLAIQTAVQFHVSVKTQSDVQFTTNIIAETKEGNPNSVIVVGSHLDGVPAGPGINDNGSGSSGNLELALATAKCLKGKLQNKIRFAWWSGEELGLLGSRFYVGELTAEERKKISFNLNFDMLASPNYIFGIYNGSSAPLPIRNLSAAIQKQFEHVFETAGTPYELLPFTGRSDYGPFIEVGIPAGGLATGAEGIKTMAQRDKFGGLANAWFDPCYHAYCDSIGNVNQHALKTNIEAAASVLEYFATARLNATQPSPVYLHYDQHSQAHARL